MSSDGWSPAPYGATCIGCSRSKAKCFHRPGEMACERCLRLGRSCEPQETSRKRKAHSHRSSPSSLERKLDDIASLLRQQIQQTGGSGSQRDTIAGETITGPPLPEIDIDYHAASVHLVRPPGPAYDSDAISQDVSAHLVSSSEVDRRLGIFRQSFLPKFPLVHLPLSSQHLRHHKPFLTLVILSLTASNIAEQFAMERTIWSIISTRIVVEHQASLDLLQGLVCFASWSHYYKQDRPFMDKLTQIALSLGRDIGLPRRQSAYDMEEARTLVALYHLTYSSWAAYRGALPPKLTPDIHNCIWGLLKEPECPLDPFLAVQLKCCVLSFPLYESTQPTPEGIRNLLIQEVDQLAQMCGKNREVEYYLASTKCLILYPGLARRPQNLQADLVFDQDRLLQLYHLLHHAKQTVTLFRDQSAQDFLGVSVDTFSRLLHALVVLFKLNTLDEPGWDLVSIKNEANVFEFVGQIRENLDRVVGQTGMVDEPTGRSGLFFKTGILFHGINALFLSQVPKEQAGQAITSAVESDLDAEAFRIPDELMTTLSTESWLSEIFGQGDTGFLDPFKDLVTRDMFSNQMG